VLNSLVSLLLSATLTALPMIPTSQIKRCVYASVYTGGCTQITSEIEHETVNLDGSSGQPGNNPPPPPPPDRQGGSNGPPPPPKAVAAPGNGLQPAPVCAPEAYYDCFEIVEPIEPIEQVTLDDLASFAPVEGAPHMEPTGWSVAGLPTNFWITTSSHVVDGELFDRGKAC
jgi:hypothetical protein